MINTPKPQDEEDHQARSFCATEGGGGCRDRGPPGRQVIAASDSPSTLLLLSPNCSAKNDDVHRLQQMLEQTSA